MHILLLILKIIGIILLLILCLLLLILCLVLFMPIHYDLAAKSTVDISTLKAKGRATWLFRAVQADVYYSDYILKWRVRILWKKFLGGQSFEDDEDAADDGLKEPGIDELSEEDLDAILDAELAKKESSQADNNKTEEKESFGGQPECGQNDKAEDTKEEITDPHDEGDQSGLSSVQDSDSAESAELDHNNMECPGEVDARENNFNDEIGEQEAETTSEKDWNTGAGLKTEAAKADSRSESKPDLEERILQFEEGIGKIKCTYHNIYDKITELYEKIELVYDFLTNEGHIHTLLKLKKWGIWLLKKILPRKYVLEGEYGFEDPQITGTVLAVYSIFRPHLNKHADLRYNFDKSILKGKLTASRNIYIYTFVFVALLLILDKKCRQSYKDVKAIMDEL